MFLFTYKFNHSSEVKSSISSLFYNNGIYACVFVVFSVVRLQCNGSGASAGIHVEELNDRKDLKSPGRQAGHWRTHCKQK